MKKLYSLEKLQELAQGDDAFVQEMVTTFINNVSEEAANMQKLMDAGDWKAIGRIAHKLAPNYAYMDSESLFSLAADIEEKVQNGHDAAEIMAMARQMRADSLVLIDELRKIY